MGEREEEESPQNDADHRDHEERQLPAPDRQVGADRHAGNLRNRQSRSRIAHDLDDGRPGHRHRDGGPDLGADECSTHAGQEAGGDHSPEAPGQAARAGENGEGRQAGENDATSVVAIRNRTGHEGEQRVPQGVGGDQPTGPGQGDVELTLEQGQQGRDEEGVGPDDEHGEEGQPSHGRDADTFRRRPLVIDRYVR